MMMTSAGISGDGSQVRRPCAARYAARAWRIATASRSNRLPAPGWWRAGLGIPARAEFHSLFEIDGPDDDILTGGQLRHEHVKTAALARPCRPANSACRRRKALGRERHPRMALARWLCYRPDGRSRPRNSFRVRVGVETRNSKRLARSSSVGYTRTAPRNVPRPDSIAGIRAVTSVMVWPRASRNLARHPNIYGRGHDLRADKADCPRDVRPCRELAFYANLPRRRRCAHHGTARTTVPIPTSCGSGGVNGPSALAMASHPPLRRSQWPRRRVPQ